MQCIVIVAKFVALTATQRFMVGKALSERYVYTSDYGTLCILLTTTQPCYLSNIATLAIWSFPCINDVETALLQINVSVIEEVAQYIPCESDIGLSSSISPNSRQHDDMKKSITSFKEEITFLLNDIQKLKSELINKDKELQRASTPVKALEKELQEWNVSTCWFIYRGRFKSENISFIGTYEEWTFKRA